MTHNAIVAAACFAGMAFIALMARIFVPQDVHRQPIPQVASQMDMVATRVNLMLWALEWEVESARRIRDAENTYLLARSKQERAQAARALIVAKRTLGHNIR